MDNDEMIAETYRLTKEMHETITRIAQVVEDVSEQVRPTLDSLSSNPMFKMLLR